MKILSVSGKKWILKKFDQNDIKYLKENFSLDEITSRLLSIRKIKKEDINSFLNPSIKNFLPNPNILEDMNKSTVRTYEAIIRKDEYIETVVSKGASIGANATIVCGNNIGSFALIGAGAVVTKEVKAYALLVGNPAKQIGWVSEYGHRLNFVDNEAKCPESNQSYKLFNEQVERIS